MDFLGMKIEIVYVHDVGVETLCNGGQTIHRFKVFGTPTGLLKAVIEGTPDLPWVFEEKAPYLPPWHGKTGMDRANARADSKTLSNNVKLQDFILQSRDKA